MTLSSVLLFIVFMSVSCFVGLGFRGPTRSG
jgi:hypothetical protein